MTRHGGTLERQHTSGLGSGSGSGSGDQITRLYSPAVRLGP
ncbi:hypothetical protein ACFFS2_26140 [Streptomyces aurantiacus]|nr:hypothetical protein [Streptomyces aurantiacus]